MQTLDVDGLKFTFPDTWQVSKFDDWAFYRRFQKAQPGLKAVDVIAVAPNQTLWLIEAKDYTRPGTPQPVDLANILIAKVLSTLSAILPAAIHGGGVPPAQDLARKATGATKIRVIAHVELPAHSSRLFPIANYETNLQQKLGQRLRAVDPHPLVLRSATCEAAGVGWRVG